MNTLRETLTVCGVAGIGFFFGYLLGFVEGHGEVKSKSEEVKSGCEVTRGGEEVKRQIKGAVRQHLGYDIDRACQI